MNVIPLNLSTILAGAPRHGPILRARVVVIRMPDGPLPARVLR